MNQVTPDTNQISLHGVFMDLFDTGVLLSGCSGIGKSELALGLINRGHRLIADDAVLIERQGDSHNLMGTCPPLLQDFLAVHGLGVLNIRAMFGDTAIQNAQSLQLIITIIQIPHENLPNIDRLHGMHRSQNILGIEIPEVSIPLTIGRNLAILVEGAVRNHVLKQTGYQASVELTQRHQAYMQQRAKENNNHYDS